MSWYTDTAPAGTAPARPWLPRMLPAADAEWRGAEPAPAPPLMFDEGELARVAAASAMRAAHDARVACAADPATRRALALEQVAAALGAAGRRRAEDDGAALRRTMALAAAIAGAADTSGGDAQALATRVGELLVGVAVPATARLVVTPSAAQELRPMLPEIAARVGFEGGLELDPDPDLADGAVQLIWTEGWLEHDPAALARRISDLLASHDTPALPATAATDGKKHDREPA